ncbi:uncharacterized protein J4E88_000984 [Alternaria novae-zelandiae]|uniref:uncharacterized protein n=1 Tax=Alternaria novae-zelandiae TaxID=430562 RepID=UPI0020C56E51|nr:uncharacterized protein J4E88_000984 [Alternaria novae-zelandiae]KAI4696805.1 hypothetical protein J4E88_000984 [Alternaria novae-zelandiae]
MAAPPPSISKYRGARPAALSIIGSISSRPSTQATQSTHELRWHARTNSEERSLISDILQDLADNCETAFDRATDQARLGTASYISYNAQGQDLAKDLAQSQPYSQRRDCATSYTTNNLREDLQEIRPYLRASTLMALEGILRLNEANEANAANPAFRRNTIRRVSTSEDGDHVPVIMDPYDDTNYSSPTSFKFDDESIMDGPLSPAMGKYPDRNYRRSNLRDAHSMSDEPFDEPPTVYDIERQRGAPKAPSPYPSTAKTAIIMLSLYISIFLVALDRTIIGPAIPAITNEFSSIGDIGWYGSAYMLTAAGFILLYGRIYTFFPTKPVFLSGIFLFELGSIICGAARNSNMLIVGRAVAGLGSSGIFTGAILIMFNTVPLAKRPMLQGLFGACFGVASVAGPLLGGAFTSSSATWRWCFYINLPLGGFTLLVVCLLLKLDEKKPQLKSWGETIRQLDPLGTALFLPSITCLLLALEWGAADYPWTSPRMVILLVAFAMLLIAFVLWQYVTRHTTATLPARIIFQRSVTFGSASQFCVGATMLTVSIYVPLWFQAIKGASAMQSGINTIPLVLSVVFGSILSGALVQRIGYYTPFMILGSGMMAIGAGLITTWEMTTDNAMWIGTQIVVGFGVGCTMQHPNIAVQTILPKEDVPTGTAVLSLFQTLGGAVFTAVGQNLYIHKFSSGLEQIGGLDPQKILDAGATNLTGGVTPAIKALILAAYNDSLTHGTFFAALVIACLAIPAAVGMEWRSVKAKPDTSVQRHDEKRDQKPQQPRGILKAPANGAGRQEGNQPAVAEPAPALKKMFRQSGQFASYLTATINPDLRDQLGPGKQVRR